jgi:hypothetical protein
MDALAKFETLVLQSRLVLAIYRKPEGGFTFCDLSPSSQRLADVITREHLTDLIRRENFVGIIGGDIGRGKPKFAFAVELTNSELSVIQASLLRVFERALIRVESQLIGGLDEDFLKRLHNLPHISMEEN